MKNRYRAELSCILYLIIIVNIKNKYYNIISINLSEISLKLYTRICKDLRDLLIYYEEFKFQNILKYLIKSIKNIFKKQLFDQHVNI